MVKDKTFGIFLRESRLKAKFGLRQFAREIGLQPSNLSNIEHGRLTPPQDRETLQTIAEVLGFEEGSEHWNLLYDLAAKDSHKILPADVEAFLTGLDGVPLLFREIKERNVSESELRELVEYVRTHYSK